MNRRFVRSVLRATPDRPGAHRVNRSATDGCSSTSGTASSPSPIAQSASLPAAHSRLFARSRPTRILTDEQLADYGPWFGNHRRLRELVAELEKLSLAITEADPRWNR